MLDKLNQDQEIKRYKAIHMKPTEEWTYDEVCFVQANYKKLKCDNCHEENS